MDETLPLPNAPTSRQTSRPTSRPAEAPRRVHAAAVGLGLVALAAAVIAALVAVFVHTARGQYVEQVVMQAMYTNPRTDRVVLHGLALVSVGAVAVAMAVVLGLGAMRRRLDLGIAAAGLIAGANVTTQLLKYGLIDRANYGWSDDNTLPSGHVTVITSILVAGLVVLPARLRPLLVPLVAFFASAAGVGTIIVNWHRPSDVVAAYAVVLGWAGLVLAAVALLGRLGGRVPGGIARAMGYAGWAAFAVCLVGVGVLVAGVYPAYGRRDMLVAALALAAVALVCAAAVALAAYAVDLLGDEAPRRAPNVPVG